MVPERKRWLVALSAILMQLCLGTVYAWSIFKIPIMSSNGWTERQTQAPFMIYGAVFALAVAFGGALTDRTGPKITGFLGGITFSAGIILTGVANDIKSIPLLILAYGLISGLGGGFGYITPIATLIRWFPDKRGLLSGLAVMGYGMGSFILGNIGPSLILRFGVADTFYFWGSACLVVIIPLSLTLTNPPQGWSPALDKPSLMKTAIQPLSFTFSEALQSSKFWIIWLMLFVSITAGLGLISQLSPMSQDVMLKALSGAVPPEKMKAVVLTSGTVVALAGIFNGLGRLSWSWISDLIGRKSVFAIIFMTMAVGFITLAHTNTIFIFSCICFYLLACYGGTMASMPALAADEFGPAHIGRIYGAIFTACGFASLCGPYVFALVKELTGSFTYALYVESAVMLVGLALVLILFRISYKAD